MVSERKDIRFPLWRKKMDSSMFQYKCTHIPDWVKDNIFKIRERFPQNTRTDPRSEVSVEYHSPDGRISHHRGWVVTTRYEKGRNDLMRFFLDEDVIENLEKDFIMTFHRTKEKIFQGWNSPTAEKKIPFYEFLDIEYDAKECNFILVPHYRQEVIYLDRFEYLLKDSH